MMGSAEALPEEPADRPMFVEDMTEEQLASAVSNTDPAALKPLRPLTIPTLHSRWNVFSLIVTIDKLET